MISELLIFLFALLIVIKSATLATTYAAKIANSFHLSRYAVGFIIVAVISILPETFISINAALTGIPSFGLATLFGSNIADLTLVFTIIILYAGRGLKVENRILRKHKAYPFLLLLPLILGLDGHFSRIDGLALVAVGIAFYLLAFHNGTDTTVRVYNNGRYKNFLLLFFSMALLLASSYLTVISATSLAQFLGVSPILIGMLIVGLGTTMPELFFALESVKKQDDSLAVGDILGTVLADATVVVGILALIQPFAFPQRIIYITGVFMVAASFILFHFMRSGRTISRRESLALLAFWILFVFVEFLANS